MPLENGRLHKWVVGMSILDDRSAENVTLVTLRRRANPSSDHNRSRPFHTFHDKEPEIRPIYRDWHSVEEDITLRLLS